MKLDGPITHFDHVYDTDENPYFFAHTLDKVYLYNTTTSTFDKDITGSTNFTGDYDNYWFSTMFKDKYIFTNGVDLVKYYGLTGPIVQNLTGTSLYVPKIILQFAARILMYNITESGDSIPLRTRWCAAGDEEDWSGSGSGASDLDGTLNSSAITTAKRLGDGVIIYGSESMVLQTYRGEYTQPFAFTNIINGLGCPAPRGVINYGNAHYFIGPDNVYKYSGGRQFDPIGDKIKDELFDLMDPAYVSRSFLCRTFNDDLLYLFYQSSSSDYPGNFFLYNISDKTWTKGEISATGFGHYLKEDADTWATVEGTWATITDRWNSRTRESEYPITLFGDEHGVIHNVSTVVYTQYGEKVNSFADTKTFVRKDGYHREITDWMEFNFRAKGTEVTVQYSTDNGNTWQEGETYTLTTDWVMYRLDLETYAETINFRFTGLEYWEIDNSSVGFIPSSDRSI